MIRELANAAISLAQLASRILTIITQNSVNSNRNIRSRRYQNTRNQNNRRQRRNRNRRNRGTNVATNEMENAIPTLIISDDSEW